MKQIVAKFERVIQNLKTPISFLHIGKTGGLNIASHFTYIDERGVKNQFRLLRRLFLPRHFKYVAHNAVPEAFCKNKNLIFVIRNPIDRFVSAFYYLIDIEANRPQARLNRVEKNLIKYFSDINEFVEAMKIDSHPHHSLAEQAFGDEGYIHYRMNYKYYFGSAELVEQRIHDVLLIGELEKYDKFIEGVNQLFGTKINPAHRTNETKKKGHRLSLSNEAWLKDFLTDDYEIYEILRNHAVN